MASEKLQVILELISGQYKREAKQVAAATGGIKNEMQNAGKSTSAMSGGLDRANKSLGAMKGVIGGLAIGAVVTGFREVIGAASELEQSIGGVEAVFGEMGDTILDASEKAADAVGLSQNAYNQLAARLGGQLQTFGFTLDETVVKTQELIQVGADLAATYGGTVSEAVEAISALLRGESNPIERYAIAINQTAINARAMAMGLAENTTQVSFNAKAQAALALLQEQSARSMGQFARESETAAGKQERLNAELENMKAEIGGALLPVWVKLLEGVKSFIPLIKQAADGMVEFTGPLEPAIDGVTKFADAIEWLNGLFDKGDTATSNWEQAMWRAARAALNPARGVLDARDAVQDFLDTLDDSQYVIDGVETGFRNHNEVIRRATSGYVGLRNTVGAADDALLNMARRGAAVDLIGDLGDEAGSAVPSVRDLAQAVADVNSAMLAAADPAFAAADAMQNYLDAIATRKTLQEDGEASAQDLAAADLEVANAALEANAAIAQFGAGSKEKAIQAIADALGESYAFAEDLLETVGILNNQEIVLPVKISMDPADRALLNNIGRGTGVNVPDTPRGYGGGRAMGGPTTKGVMNRVGENNRPEILHDNSGMYLIPGDSGRMFSFADAQKLISSASGGGGDLTINFQGSDPVHDLGLFSTIAGVVRRVETARR